MTGKNHLITAFALLGHLFASGQIRNVGLPDSLLTKDYHYFIRELESDRHDLETAKIYSTAYLAKAKGEQNWEEIVSAYKSILHQSELSLKTVYADSMIYAARHTVDNELIASAFLTKGIVHYSLREHSFALDNFLTANELLLDEEDQYLKHKVKFNIAKIKYYLGFYSEAMPLFKDCVSFYRIEEDMPYLVSLHHLGLCYIKTGRFDLCSSTNELGIREAYRIELPDAAAHFIHCEGVNQYFKKNYETAIQKLQHSLPGIIASRDLPNETIAYFFIGKSFWSMKQHSKAVPYFEKVDQAFSNKHFIQPDLRENYELLIDYYKDRKDLDKQLFYINRLLAADRVLEKNYRYLSGKIHKEYNTRELLQSKKEIEGLLVKERRRNIIAVAVIILLIFLVAYLTYKYFENRLYKKKYKEYMAKKNKPREQVQKTISNDDALEINLDVVNTVLAQLEAFESGGGFLETDLKQERLAVIFGTNPKYISKIIKHYKGKKSNDYINDLKIDYVIELLKKEKRYRNYTNKALAEEIGFSTTQHFTRAFYARTGMAASFFIKQLVEELDSAVAKQ